MALTIRQPWSCWQPALVLICVVALNLLNGPHVLRADQAVSPRLSGEHATTESLLMPWRPCWQVPAFTLALVIFGSRMVIFFARTESATLKRFGVFYRGDISAFLAEHWMISVTMMPGMALLLFLCAWFRHPTRSADGTLQSWNVAAVNIAAVASVGVTGLSIFTQKDNTGTSRYLLQTDVVHGIFMVLGFGSLIVYECLHTMALVHGVVCGALHGLAVGIAALEIAFTAGTAMHFTLWIAEACKEEYPDDPRCNKRSEWICVLCTGCYWLTLPIITQCLSDPSLSAHVFVYALTFLLCCVAIFALCGFRVLKAGPPDAEVEMKEEAAVDADAIGLTLANNGQ